MMEFDGFIDFNKIWTLFHYSSALVSCRRSLLDRKSKEIQDNTNIISLTNLSLEANIHPFLNVRASERVGPFSETDANNSLNK